MSSRTAVPKALAPPWGDDAKRLGGMSSRTAVPKANTAVRSTEVA